MWAFLHEGKLYFCVFYSIGLDGEGGERNAMLELHEDA
jgi:hypothetical protein